MFTLEKMFTVSRKSGTLLFIICGAFLSSEAQFFFKKIHNIPVTDTNGRVLKYPWVGGLNNPQFSAADINNDGIKDLVIFNRSNIHNGDRVYTFINNNTPGLVSYEYAPHYETGFPFTDADSPRVQFWMLMADYNCDGIDDIFSGAPGYIYLFEGKYDNDNKINFTYKNYLQFNSFSGPLNIFVSSVDVPAITDVNGDGDIDVLTFNIFGYVIEYYENQSKEHTGACGDSIIFELVDDCWGNIYESGLRRAVDIRDTCGTLVIPKNARHPGGSSLLAFDIDADGDKDVLIGGITYPSMTMLYNGGNSSFSHIVWQDTLFPIYDTPIDMLMFPVGFYLDVDNDGNKDLIVAPNTPKRSQNYFCAHWYKNISSTSQDTFQLRNQAFIVEEMIDLGEGAYPVFVDFNQDSLIDLVVGNYGYYTLSAQYWSGLALFQNIGTRQSPAFKLISRDGYNLSALNLRALAPAFGDMDSDGDLDMIVGEENGELYYFTNTAGAGNPFNFVLTSPKYKAIDIGQYSTPFIFDVDGDALPDLVVGERSGNLNYFRNIGSDTLPDFDRNPTNSFFGKIDVVDRNTSQITGYSAPVFSSLDSSGLIYLLVGSESDGIKVYEFNRDSILSGAFTKLHNRYSNIHEGERNTITLADLNDDGKMEMVVGNYRGGLSFYTQSDSLIIPISSLDKTPADAFDVKVYPIPAQSEVTFHLSRTVAQQLSMDIYDSKGKCMFSYRWDALELENIIRLSVLDWPKGVYIVRMRSNMHVHTKKLLVY